MKKTTKAVSYDEWILKKLKDDDVAVAYLNNALKEAEDGDNESLERLLIALKNVIQVQEGMAKIAKF